MIPNFLMPDEVDSQAAVRMDPEILSSEAIIIHLTGYIDTYNSEFFAKQMNAVMTAGYSRIILACKGINYLSSTGVGAFTNILKTLGTKGEVVIAEAQQKILEVFQLLGFSSFFRIFDSLDAAKQHILSDASTSKLEIFPKVMACLICTKQLKVSKSGIFRCPECKTGLIVDINGAISLK
jgi:anti-sigma B factor antagonist